MADTSVDVLVVGAGPTGLTMAAQLAACGVLPRVVDRALDRVHESRALAVQPRTLEVLAGLGVGAELRARGNPAVQLVLHGRGRARAVPLFDLGLPDTAYPYLLFLSQAVTEEVLGEHCAGAGVSVERGVELVGLVPGPEWVEATLRHGDGRRERVRARWVVGCDGAHSAVREGAGIGFVGDSYPQSFVLADTEADGLAPDAVHAYLAGDGLVAFFPLRTPATWRILASRPRAAARPSDNEGPVTLAQVQELVDAVAGGAVRLRDPVWLAGFRLHHRHATRYRAGRVFLAGDSAHIHSPAGAQGMNTGIQDAVNLGWKLAYTVRGLTDPAVLDTYEAERAPVGQRVLRLTDRGFTAAMSTAPLSRFARTRVAPAVLPLLLGIRSVRAAAFRTVSQLGIRYRRSPLSVGGAGTGGPHAGDRLPDAPLTGPAGRDTSPAEPAGHDTPARDHSGPSTVHELVAEPAWHLILCGPPGMWPPEPVPGAHAGVLRVHRVPRPPRVLGRPGDILLVRPDGYIGYRGTGPDLTGLTGYLDRWWR